MTQEKKWISTQAELPDPYRKLIITNPYYPKEVCESVAIMVHDKVIFTYEEKDHIRGGYTRYFNTDPAFWMYAPTSPFINSQNS